MDNFNFFLNVLITAITFNFINTVIQHFSSISEQQRIYYWHWLNTFAYKFLKATTIFCLIWPLGCFWLLKITKSKFTFEDCKNIYDFASYAVISFFLMLSFRSDFRKADQFNIDNQ